MTVIATKKINWWRTHFDETDINGLIHTLRNECVSMGPVTVEFEEAIAKQLNVPFVVATSSGSMALLMSMMVFNVGQSDEVIIPNRTWIAAAHAAKLLGAKVVLVDVEKNSPIIDANELEKFITPKTKAIVPTPLNGRSIDMQRIWQLAKKYHFHVIEDAAQGLMCRYRENNEYMGTKSDVGCFSLSVAKLIPTGQGGFIVTHDKSIYEKLISIRTHGVKDMVFCHFDRLGFNFRITDLQASLGITQLERIEQRIAAINRIYLEYERALLSIDCVKLIPVQLDKGEIPLYVEVLCSKRNLLVDFLNKRGIQVRPFYPNLNAAKYLSCHGSFPNAEYFASQGLVLPCGPAQSLENISLVIEALKDFSRV